MKNCELCGSRARMYCESDQASLCWDCDSKVHGANFLVAKHSRSLLCHVCHSPTPWNASGPKLTPTVSVCEACVDFHRRRRSNLNDPEVEDDDDDEEEDIYGGNDDDDEEEQEEEENGENQVVPWSFSSSSPPTLDGASSSTEDREVRSFDSKRSREVDVDLDSDAETTSCGSFRSTKRARLSDEVNKIGSESFSSSLSSSSFKATAMAKSLERLKKDAITGDENPSTMGSVNSAEMIRAVE